MSTPIYDGNDSNITQIRYRRDKSLSVSISKGYGTTDGTMHPVYGSIKYYPSSTPKSPYVLKLPKPGGGFYTQNEAFVELKKPIYGPNFDKQFIETLPTLTPITEPKYIMVSNFTPISILPTEPGNYILRKLFDKDKGIYMYSNALPLESAPWWYLTGFEEWKPEGMENYHQELNPNWVDVDAINQAEKAEYERILKETFKLFGTYIFPSLPTNDPIIPGLIADTTLQIAYWNKTHDLIPDPNWVRPTQTEIEAAKLSGIPIQTTPTLITSWTEANRWTATTIPERFLYKWEILQNGVWKQLPVMNDYWLATASGGWLNKLLEIPNNVNSSIWDAKVGSNILLIPPKYTWDFKLKNLLGL